MKFEIEIDEQKVKDIINTGVSVDNLPNQVAYAVRDKAVDQMARKIASEHTGSLYETKELLGDIRKKIMDILEPAIRELAEAQMKSVWNKSNLENIVKGTVNSQVQQIIEDRARAMVSKLLVVTPEEYDSVASQPPTEETE